MTIEYTIGEKNLERQQLLAGFLDPLTLKALRHISLKPGDWLLDAGCGIGDTTLMLAQHFPGAIITGLDADAALTAHATATKALRQPQLNFVTGDATCLPFDSNHFDFVFSRFMVHHIADAATAFKELKRVCKPGGIVFIQEPDINFFGVYPHSPAYPIMNDVVNALFADTQMGRKLIHYFRWLELKNIRYDARIVLAEADHVLKRFYSLTAEAMEKSILEKKLMTAEEMVNWKKELKRVELDPQSTVLTHPVIAVWGIK